MSKAGSIVAIKSNFDKRNSNTFDTNSIISLISAYMILEVAFSDDPIAIFQGIWDFFWIDKFYWNFSTYFFWWIPQILLLNPKHLPFSKNVQKN